MKPTEKQLEEARRLMLSDCHHVQQPLYQRNCDRCIATALAEARRAALEEAARVALNETEKHRLRDDLCRMDACIWVASSIRSLISPQGGK